MQDKESWDNHWKNKMDKEFSLIADYSRIKENEIILKEINNKKNLKILDVGSGCAHTSLDLAKKGHIIYALDFSKEALKKAEKLYAARGLKENLKTIYGDINDIPFNRNTFDVVYNQGVLEHATDPKHVVDEMIRVTKPNGKICAFVSNKYTFLGAYYKLYLLLNKKIPWPFGKQNFYNYKKVLSFFDKKKGDIIRITGVVPFSLEIFIRNKIFKNICKYTIIPIINSIESILPDKVKALFGRQNCIVMVKK